MVKYKKESSSYPKWFLVLSLQTHQGYNFSLRTVKSYWDIYTYIYINKLPT